MSETNPYQSPEDGGSSVNASTISFGRAIKRGFSAAHGAPAGAVWMLLLMAPLQMLGSAVNAMMFGTDLFEKMQSGDFGANGGQPPPELFMMMGFGCFACLWFPVLLLALPWVWGGTIGQIRDRVVGKVPDSFGRHGKRHYVSMLLLFLMFIGAVIVVSIPNAIVGQIIASTEVKPGEPMTAEQMRALSQHPGNIASSIVTGLLMAGVGMILNFIASAVAARDRGIGDGLNQGFSCVGRNLGDACKLYFLYLLLILPLAFLQWIPQLRTPTMGLALATGFISSLLIAYLGVVNFGLAGSLFAARVDSDGDAATFPSA